MKKKFNSLKLILLALMVTVFTVGCQKTISFNSDNVSGVPDGINFNLNVEQNIDVNYTDPSATQGSPSGHTESEDENSDDDGQDDSGDVNQNDNQNPDDGKENDNHNSDDNADGKQNDDQSSGNDEDADSNFVNNGNEDHGSDDGNSDSGEPVVLDNNSGSDVTVSEDGEYNSKEEVALYIHLYGHLPSNYITKNEAKELGWVSSKGNLNDVAPGKSIGGDRFGNREELLPIADGRQYYECDIDYKKGTRNSKRIVYSNDGLVYYTEDHYKTYELLYE